MLSSSSAHFGELFSDGTSRANVLLQILPVKQHRLPAIRALKDHVDTVLHDRHMSRKDLAQACGKSESWISKIFKEDERTFSMHDLDAIADALGLEVHQLFQPGISRLSERRSGAERRTNTDRRIGHSGRLISYLRGELNKVSRNSTQPPRSVRDVVAAADLSAVPSPVAQIIQDADARIAAWYRAHSEKTDLAARHGAGVASRRDRSVPRSDARSDKDRPK